MHTHRVPLSALAFLYLVFIACLLFTSDSLPDRVATHFDLQGRPNGWMSRSAHLFFIGGFGMGLPLVILGIFLVVRRFPSAGINIPHRDYWFAPERRAESVSYLFRHSYWLAAGTLIFITGVHLLVVYANRQVPAQMPLAPLLLWAGCLIVGIAIWATLIIRHFKRPEAQVAATTEKTQ